MDGILIVGGSGFVGRALLNNLDIPLYIISRRELSNVQDGVQIVQTDLEDVEALAKILPKCRWLIHVASDSTPSLSSGKPLYEAYNNLIPNLKLFELLQDFPDVNIIFLSSGGTVYGNSMLSVQNQPVQEKTPLHPLSYYAAGKIALEAFIAALVQQTPRTAIILRPSNLYGPGQLYRSDFGIIPTILNNLSLDKPIQIWGDGESVRDYLYIDDFIELCQILIQQDNLIHGTHIFNVGSGKGYSLNQLCEIFEQVTGKSIQREYFPSRSVDVQHIVLDSSSIKKEFGWQAKIELKEGLQNTYEWWCKK